MNPLWLLRNTSRSWRYRAGTRDFAKSLAWVYAGKLANRDARREWEIGFRYPEPLGAVRLLLRGNGGSDAFIHGEVFSHEYYRLPLPAPPATILDLGSNAGLTAVYFARTYPSAELACVEPFPDNLRVLRRNLELNGVRATVFAAAVDARDGTLSLALDAMDYGHRIANGNDSAPTIEVSALCIPTLLERLKWRRIGLLKIDIEGHEKTLFSGDCGWLDRVDAMCIECHGAFGSADLVRIAGRYGFDPPQFVRGIWLLCRRRVPC